MCNQKTSHYRCGHKTQTGAIKPCKSYQKSQSSFLGRVFSGGTQQHCGKLSETNLDSTDICPRCKRGDFTPQARIKPLQKATKVTEKTSSAGRQSSSVPVNIGGRSGESQRSRRESTPTEIRPSRPRTPPSPSQVAHIPLSRRDVPPPQRKRDLPPPARAVPTPQRKRDTIDQLMYELSGAELDPATQAHVAARPGRQPSPSRSRPRVVSPVSPSTIRHPVSPLRTERSKPSASAEKTQTSTTSSTTPLTRKGTGTGTLHRSNRQIPATRAEPEVVKKRPPTLGSSSHSSSSSTAGKTICAETGRARVTTPACSATSTRSKSTRAASYHQTAAAVIRTIDGRNLEIKTAKVYIFVETTARCTSRTSPKKTIGTNSRSRETTSLSSPGPGPQAQATTTADNVQGTTTITSKTTSYIITTIIKNNKTNPQLILLTE
ncbi:hypothetical protein QBC47DRAFT_358084 [Echria macrotheca]|uniref:Uncharacterized protein n=1 Tax=Echria macrotheca TaxID=438768 RepID=A0AAJ0BJ90_9PEZI|nr:hypothetical protein QBC47DRAFT_358084 [Echria macrotheca]